MQTQSSRTARYDGDFAIEGEDVLEVIELDVGFGGHDEGVRGE